MSSYKLCMGVMSGTSLDGIDVALCRVKGSGVDTDIELVAFETYKYSDEVFSDIKKLLSLIKVMPSYFVV